jgi:hypothetical protein
MPRLSKEWRARAASVARARKLGEKNEKLLAESFRAHWKAVEADFASGVDVARDRAHCFFARDSRIRLRMARRYYSPARVTKFAHASTNEILDLCWAWFIPFQVSSYRSEIGGSYLPSFICVSVREQLEQLVAAEYVAMRWQVFDAYRPYYDLEWEAIEDVDCYACADLYPLPDLTTELGDVYETIVLSETGQYLRVCKSVATPFSEAERTEAMGVIAQQFFQDAIEEGEDPRTWSVDFRCAEHSRSWIEADILPEVGSAYEKETHRTLVAELRDNGTRYLKRLRPRIRP